MTDPVHKPSRASFCFTSASEAGCGHSHWIQNWPAQAAPACAEMQAQAELVSRQDSSQAVPRGTCAIHSTCRAGQGIRNPLSENGTAGNSELCRKLQILLGCLCCPYSEWSELSCFKNLHCCKAEDNRGAHLCKMPAKGRQYCLHVPLLCPAQYWTRSDQLLLFALFCSDNKEVQGNPEQNVEIL